MNTFLLAQNVSPAIVIGGGLLFAMIALVVIVAKLIVVGNPSEMLVISGKRQKEGQGYRVLIGGRTLVIPIIEKVSKLSLRNMQVGLEVSAQAGGGDSAAVCPVGAGRRFARRSTPAIRNAVGRRTFCAATCR